MKIIIKYLMVFLLTALFGVLYYTLNHIADSPPEPNMFILGAVINILFYSIINTFFILILYVTTYTIDKESCGKVLSAKKILIEISVLYVLIYILSHIPYIINILPISKITEKDIFVAFGPFIILYLSWIGMLLLRKKNIG